MGLATKALAFRALQEEALGWGKVRYMDIDIDIDILIYVYTYVCVCVSI